MAAGLFDRYRVPLYKEASYKPYIIAAMITLARKRNPADLLLGLLDKGGQRCLSGKNEGAGEGVPKAPPPDLPERFPLP